MNQENLIHLFTKLSLECTRDFNKNATVKDKTDRQAAVRKLRNVAFDCLRCDSNDPKNQVQDDWRPEIVLTDYAFRLINENKEYQGRKMFEEVAVCQRNSYFAMDSIWKLLVCLEGFDKTNIDTFQHPFSFSGLPYFIQNSNPYSMLPSSHFGREVSLSSNLASDNKLKEVEGEQTDLFINQFIKERKTDVSPAMRPVLNDFVETSTLFTPLQLKKWPPMNGLPEKVKQNEVGRNLGTNPTKTADADKPYVEQLEPASKRDIFDGLEYLFQTDSEVMDVPIITPSYESQKLDIFKRCIRSPKSDPVRKKNGLLLAVHEESLVLRKLIEPDFVIPKLEEVSEENLIQKIKHLICGVDSHIFPYDLELKKFFMKEGTFISGVTPDCLFEICKSFLEAGTNFLEITAFCEGLDSSIGVLYSVLQQSVNSYLVNYRESVMLLEGGSGLAGFTPVAEDLVKTMSVVHRVCLRSIGPLPDSGPLLTHLYESCRLAYHPRAQNAIFTMLCECCATYISKFVEPWVFQGCLERSWSSELFVKIKDLSDRRDRTCYLSPSLDPQLVPSFFRSYAADIFACGKAAWLLKLFDPENKFFYFLESLRYPKMKICTTAAEFDELNYEFDKYEKTVNELCGERVSFLTIKQAEREQEELRVANMKIIQKEIMEMLEERKNSRLHIQREKLKEREILLREQMQAVVFNKERKMGRRDRSKENSAAPEENVADQMALRKEVTDKYQKLSEMADHMKNEAEWQAKRLELHQQRVDFLNSVDNNERMLDEEGNFIFCSMDVANSNITPPLPVTLLAGYDPVCGNDVNCNTDVLPSDEIEGATPPSIGNIEAINDEAANITNNNINSEYYGSDSLETLPHRLALAEARNNKMKVLGTEFGCETKSYARRTPDGFYASQKNKIKVLGCHTGPTDDSVTCELPANVTHSTDAQKNKNKVLGSEWGLTDYSSSVECKPTHIEKLPEKLTDAQKNKLKVLGTEYDFNSPTVPKSGTCLVSKPDSDLLRNKIKVLGLEYDLIRASNETNAPICHKNSTEAMKNKERMMSCDSDRASLKESQNASSGPLTDRRKNKLKMLSTEIEHDTCANVVASRQESSAPESSVRLENAVLITNPDSYLELCNPEVSTRRNMFAIEKVDAGLIESVTRSHIHKSIDFASVDLDVTMFARYVQKSISIAVKAQRRLANGTILKHFIEKENVMMHLQCLRSFFLHFDGEFSRNLTHGLFYALQSCSEPHQFFDKAVISGILNEALIHTSQQNSQNLSFKILTMPTKLVLEAHDVLAPFQLSYKVNWPLNIILTEASLERYTKVFSVLVNLKRVHWTLNETFLLLKTQTKDKSLDGKRLMNSPEYTKLATYRHAMTLFIMTLEEHICANGPQEAWLTFQKHLETVEDLEELYQKHVAFVKDVSRRCFLVKATQDLLSYINELIELGLQFHFVLKSTNWRLINPTHYSHPKFALLKTIFLKFCKTTKTFNKTLRKKTQHAEMKAHIPLLELFDLKIKV